MHKQISTRFSHAVVRTPGRDFAHGITTSNLGTPSYELILKQHREYIQILQYVGLKVIVLDPLPNYPDAYFVEDVAVVIPEVAVITNPGAEDRKGEATAIEPVLATYRDIARIHAPGTVDGGDILMVDSHFFIGISERTNQEGAEQLSVIFEQYGYTWTLLYVESGLHLKSSVNFIGNNTLLLTEHFADRDVFKGYNHIIVGNAEGYSANTLLIRDSLLTPKGFPDTLGKLASTGFNIIEMEMSEVRKMDGGLTCMSLRF